MNAKVGAFNTSTGTLSSTQEITIGFEAKIIFFWWSGEDHSSDAVTGKDSYRGFGVATSTSNRYCFTTYSQNAAGNATSSEEIDNRYVIVAVQAAGTVQGAIDISAIGATSFTLIVDDVMPVDLRVHYLALGGSDIVNATAGSVQAGADGRYIVSGLSFQPNFAMLFGGAGVTTIPGVSATASPIGIGIATSSTNQATLTAGTDDNSATMDTGSYNTDNQFHTVIDNPVGTVIAQRNDFSNFDSGGFTCTVDTSGFVANLQAIYVALNCTNVIVGNSLTQTDTTTDIVISGLGWKPAAGMIFSHCRAETTTSTLQRTDKTSMGAFTSASERGAQGVRDEDNVADSNVATAVEHDEVYVHIDDTNDSVIGLMDVKSVDSGGVTFIMDDADPAQAFFGYVLFGPAEAGGETKTVTDSGAGADVLSLSASLQARESGVGSDSLAQLASLSLPESSSSTDLLQLLASLSVGDFGSGTEVLSILQAILKIIQDIGVGLDDIANLSATLSMLENATGLDLSTLLASLSMQELGQGVDNQSLAALLGLVDGGVGGDFLDLAASLSMSELGTGVDSSSQLASFSVSESGASSDFLQLLASLSLVDSGTGSDNISILQSILKLITDLASGIDNLSIQASLSVVDTGTEQEAIQLSATLSVADVGTGIDAETVSKAAAVIKQILDLASGLDSLSISASLSLPEQSLGADSLQLLASIQGIDLSTASDQLQLQANLSVLDASSATDAVSILQAILKMVQDLATGTDAIGQISASLAVSDFGLSNDQLGQLLAYLIVTDFGTGIEVVIKYDVTSQIVKISFIIKKEAINFEMKVPRVEFSLSQPEVEFSFIPGDN